MLPFCPSIPLLLISALLGTSAISMFAAGKPNILVIVSDDQGYVDAGFQGGRDALTPNLDKLAASGVRCTNGYVSYPVCSPSRAGLLTGRHQARFGHENNPVYDPLDPREGLPLTEKLLPEYLKSAGYVTGWMGKWHLGASPAHVPWQRGFDQTFGFIGGGHRYLGWQPNQFQYTLPLIREGKDTTETPGHLTTALGSESAAYIRRHKDQPWFLYLAFNAPHTPHEPTPESLAKFAHIQEPQRRRCLAQIALLDDAIGTVTTALADSDQTGRTLVFFFSDNGGAVPTGADNGTLRGHKGQLYEGGIRVPFLVAWPEKLPAGKTWEHPVSTLDVLTTCLAAAAIPAPQDRVLDGIDLVPAITSDKPTVPRTLFWRLQGNTFATRDGDWKLLQFPGKPVELYNLVSDRDEKTNLADAQPELRDRLATLLADWKKLTVSPIFPGSRIKNEDWGPGGANEAKRSEQRKAKESRKGE